jgi:hypothetical protein
MIRFFFQRAQLRHYLDSRAGEIHPQPLTKLLAEIRQIVTGLYNEA